MKKFAKFGRKQWKIGLLVFIISLALILVLFCDGSDESRKMYPHEEVEMELTREESETKAFSGRTWKLISGAAHRQDMEYGELRYSVYLPDDYDDKKEYPLLLYLHGGDLGYQRSGGHTPWTKELNGFDVAYAEIIAGSRWKNGTKC